MSTFISQFGDDEQVSDEIYLARMRGWRNRELIATDWTQIADAPTDKAAWAKYRQGLRELPNSNKNPRLIELPIKPDEA
jgi:hypothetical protein